MTGVSIQGLRGILAEHEQAHVLRFWEDLAQEQRRHLAGQIEAIDFPLIERLVDAWIRGKPKHESFKQITPAPVVPKAGPDRAEARDAWDAGEEVLRKGRVGLVLVAGGQGTRLGFDGPKGAFPIGPVSKRSLFAFHAEKIHNLQRRYGCTLPWYIMVGETNEAATQEFFLNHDFFGLRERDVRFFKQRMMPCVDEDGKFLLDSPHRLAMNPNGHGGSIPALVENGITHDAHDRGIDTLSYFQVDNWAVQVADPYFIGCHVLGDGEFSSKVHRKHKPKEAAGVFCLCDGKLRVIEYTEFDLYPELLETDSGGRPIHFATNAAIHILSVDFVERVAKEFDDFPWHCSHKQIPHVDEGGTSIQPETPNGYKFETFVFDALRFVKGAPVALEIAGRGEYTPTKRMTGPDSIEAAHASMAEYWAEWLEAAGCPVPRDGDGTVAIEIEISPQFALTKEEFLKKTRNRTWPKQGTIAIGPEGAII